MARCDVIVDLAGRKPLEAHFRFDHLLTELSAGGDEADAGINPVAAARQKMQRGKRFFRIFGLFEDTAADGNDRIGRQDIAVPQGWVVLDGAIGGLGLFARQPTSERAGMLGTLRRLIDIHRHQPGRLDADLVEKIQTARRTRCQYQLLLKRHFRPYPAEKLT
ncbi:hypothetical protein D3C73_484910 [compost metagenome]